MEAYNSIVEFIQVLGFPIVCCGVLFWYIIKKDKQHKEEMSEIRGVVEKMGVAISNNTAILEKFLLKFGGDNVAI